MNCMSEDPEVEKYFHEAKNHLIKAGLEAANILLSEKLKYFEDKIRYSFHNYPEFFIAVIQKIKNISNELKYLSSDGQFQDYQKIIADIIDFDNKINPIILKFKAMVKRNKREMI